MLHVSAIEKKAEENIRKWMFSEGAKDRVTRGKVKENVGPYVLVSRETGAGGSEIARLVGEQLGWDVLDNEIVDYLVDHYGTSRSLVEFIDERRSNWINEIFTSWIEGLGYSSGTYVHRLNQLFLLAAHHGNVMIVGRGARFILPREHGLSVRILAPIGFRAAQIAMKRGLSMKEAHRFVENSDRQREAFVREHFHRKAADPHMYDLVINVKDSDRQGAADLIVEATGLWLKGRT
ncbi:MAG: cytidylate kinase-like family protein [Candidatus Paceibacterota bacterium]